MKIALDCMSGDKASDGRVIRGGLEALEESNVELVMVGDQDFITNHLGSHINDSRISIVHSPNIIEMDREVTTSIIKEESSMLTAIELVRNGNANAIVCCGNTKALTTMCVLKFGRIPSIKKPAITVVMPIKNKTIFLDAGAMVDYSPEELRQLAVMGSIYATIVLGKENPKIGLLSVGEEAGKGNEMAKKAWQLLADSELNFVGNVEPKTLLYTDTADVVVTDGFTGNLVLKTLEDTIKYTIGLFLEEAKKTNSDISTLIGKVKGRIDCPEHGGAIILGVQHTCIKSHGSADEQRVKNAIFTATKAVEGKIVEQITKEINQIA